MSDRDEVKVVRSWPGGDVSYGGFRPEADLHTSSSRAAPLVLG
jgi:hypothetical protein